MDDPQMLFGDHAVRENTIRVFWDGGPDCGCEPCRARAATLSLIEFANRSVAEWALKQWPGPAQVAAARWQKRTGEDNLGDPAAEASRLKILKIWRKCGYEKGYKDECRHGAERLRGRLGIGDDEVELGVDAGRDVDERRVWRDGHRRGERDGNGRKEYCGCGDLITDPSSAHCGTCSFLLRAGNRIRDGNYPPYPLRSHIEIVSEEEIGRKALEDVLIEFWRGTGKVPVICDTRGPVLTCASGDEIILIETSNPWKVKSKFPDRPRTPERRDGEQASAVCPCGDRIAQEGHPHCDTCCWVARAAGWIEEGRYLSHPMWDGVLVSEFLLDGAWNYGWPEEDWDGLTWIDTAPSRSEEVQINLDENPYRNRGTRAHALAVLRRSLLEDRIRNIDPSVMTVKYAAGDLGSSFSGAIGAEARAEEDEAIKELLFEIALFQGLLPGHGSHPFNLHKDFAEGPYLQYFNERKLEARGFAAFPPQEADDAYLRMRDEAWKEARWGMEYMAEAERRRVVQELLRAERKRQREAKEQLAGRESRLAGAQEQSAPLMPRYRAGAGRELHLKPNTGTQTADWPSSSLQKALGNLVSNLGKSGDLGQDVYSLTTHRFAGLQQVLEDKQKALLEKSDLLASKKSQLAARDAQELPAVHAKVGRDQSQNRDIGTQTSEYCAAKSGEHAPKYTKKHVSFQDEAEPSWDAGMWRPFIEGFVVDLGTGRVRGIKEHREYVAKLREEGKTGCGMEGGMEGKGKGKMGAETEFGVEGGGKGKGKGKRPVDLGFEALVAESFGQAEKMRRARSGGDEASKETTQRPSTEHQLLDEQQTLAGGLATRPSTPSDSAPQERTLTEAQEPAETTTQSPSDEGTGLGAPSPASPTQASESSHDAWEDVQNETLHASVESETED